MSQKLCKVNVKCCPQGVIVCTGTVHIHAKETVLKKHTEQHPLLSINTAEIVFFKTFVSSVLDTFSAASP